MPSKYIPVKKAEILYMDGDELKAWQKRNDLSNGQMALFLGVSVNAVCLWRREKHLIDRRTWMILSIYDGKDIAIAQEIETALADIRKAEDERRQAEASRQAA